jgi:hypothetical protein
MLVLLAVIVFIGAVIFLPDDRQRDSPRLLRVRIGGASPAGSLRA